MALPGHPARLSQGYVLYHFYQVFRPRPGAAIAHAAERTTPLARTHPFTLAKTLPVDAPGKDDLPGFLPLKYRRTAIPQQNGLRRFGPRRSGAIAVVLRCIHSAAFIRARRVAKLRKLGRRGGR